MLVIAVPKKANFCKSLVIKLCAQSFFVTVLHKYLQLFLRHKFVRRFVLCFQSKKRNKK